MKKVLITGSNGFIGKNLKLYLTQFKDIQVTCFDKDDEVSFLPEILKKVDFIFHLAGVNRSMNDHDFQKYNTDFTKKLSENIKNINKKISIVFASSIQAESDNLYGKSKKNAEDILINLSKEHGINIYLFRLPNVFGKWSKPNYNSVVATFCYNISRKLPIQINDRNKNLELVYIDDVMQKFIELLNENQNKIEKQYFVNITPVYRINLGDLVKKLYAFKKIESTGIMEDVGTGLTRALYSTYISYLPKEKFSYPVISKRF